MAFSIKTIIVRIYCWDLFYILIFLLCYIQQNKLIALFLQALWKRLFIHLKYMNSEAYLFGRFELTEIGLFTSMHEK